MTELPPEPAPRRVKSRNVNGYIARRLKWEYLADKLAQRESKLIKLKRKVEDAKAGYLRVTGKLTGGQMAEANRIIHEYHEAKRNYDAAMGGN